MSHIMTKKTTLAKCSMHYDKDTCTWLGTVALNGKVLATVTAWSKAGIKTQLTDLIRRY